MHNASLDIPKFVRDISHHVIDSFNHTLGNPKDVITYSINCRDLEPKFLEWDIRGSAPFSSMFKELADNDAPCVYWFEVLNGPDNAAIHSCFNEYKKSSIRGVPALKDLNGNNSRILYVGKSTAGFWGRLITHMGYLAGNGTTQGLQLDYWAKSLCLELQLNILQFPNAMADYLSIVEYALAKKLQPIIGKHRR